MIAVEGGEDERDGVAGHRHAVAELAHQRLGGVRQRLEPRQSEEAAGALDGVNEPEDVAEDRFVVRILLEPNQFEIDGVEMLARFRQKLAQKIVHDENSTHATQDYVSECRRDRFTIPLQGRRAARMN